MNFSMMRTARLLTISRSMCMMGAGVVVSAYLCVHVAGVCSGMSAKGGGGGGGVCLGVSARQTDRPI